jgi:hypothetical protein
MSRSIHAKTASGDAITLEASADASGRGRSLAHLEHSAMQALGLVRAASGALRDVTRMVERTALVVSRGSGLLEAGLKPELKRMFAELAQHIRSADYAGHGLLDGGMLVVSLDDAGHGGGVPLAIELPDLVPSLLGEGGLCELDLQGSIGTGSVQQRVAAAQTALHKAEQSLQASSKALLGVLQRLHDSRAIPGSQRTRDEGFIALIGQLRERLLRSGASALRVQGAPSTRAVWLVEGTEQQPF